jgi:hypothetical protein
MELVPRLERARIHRTQARFELPQFQLGFICRAPAACCGDRSCVAVAVGSAGACPAAKSLQRTQRQPAANDAVKRFMFNSFLFSALLFANADWHSIDFVADLELPNANGLPADLIGATSGADAVHL